MLVADDDLETRAATSELLADMSYWPVTTRNGLEELEYLRRGVAPIAMLIDLYLPLMDGAGSAAARPGAGRARLNCAAIAVPVDSSAMLAMRPAGSAAPRPMPRTLLWLALFVGVPVEAQAPPRDPAAKTKMARPKASAAPSPPQVDELLPLPAPDVPSPPSPDVAPREREAAPPPAPVPEAEPRSGVGVDAAVRGGVWWAHSALGLGPVVGAELGYSGLFDGAVRFAVGAAYVHLASKVDRIVPGRGYEPALIQNATLVPIDLSVSWAPLRGDFGVAIGVGLSLTYGRSDFIAFSSPSSASAWSPAFLAVGRLRYRLGPGHAFLDLRHTEGSLNLGALGRVGTDSLRATAFCLGYAAQF